MMKRSEERLLTTHVGGLPRPESLLEHPSILWAKFESLVEGARLATRQLWGTSS